MSKNVLSVLGETSIVKTDALLAMTIIVVEKLLLETEFTCPCQGNNGFKCDGLIAGSSLIIVFVVIAIQIPHYKKLQECCECTIFSCAVGICLSAAIAVLTWLTVWFFDGHYYVCRMSSWEGKWNETSLKVSHKWCKPPIDPGQEKELVSQDWFFHSKVGWLHYSFIQLKQCN